MNTTTTIDINRKWKERKNPSKTVAGSFAQLIDPKESVEVKVGQLEIKLQTLEATLTEKKRFYWAMIGFIATVAGIGLGVLTFINGLVKDTINTYRNLHDTYYKELISTKNDLYNLQKDIYKNEISKTGN